MKGQINVGDHVIVTSSSYFYGMMGVVTDIIPVSVFNILVKLDRNKESRDSVPFMSTELSKTKEAHVER